MSNIIQALNWRYATKKYDSTKKLSSQHVELLLESIRLSPTSFGLQSYRVFNITNPDLRLKLRDAAWNQSSVSEASHLLVFAASTQITPADVDAFITLVGKTRNMPVDALTGYADIIKASVASRSDTENAEWSARQAYLGLGVLLATAALEEIDATPMEGFDPKQFDEILGLAPLKLKSVVMIALGTRSEEDAFGKLAKVRVAKDKLIIQK